MICPVCQQWVPRRGWTPTQWNSCNPMAQGWYGCNHCRRRQVPGDGLGIMHAQLVAAKEHLATIALEAPPRFASFVIYWMEELRADYRKCLSYMGLVREFPGSPVGYFRSAGFDPGNLIYSRCLHVVAFSAVNEFPWNLETQGDIVEAMLAFFQNKAGCHAHYFKMHEFLQDLCKTVWQVSAFGNDFHSDAITWLSRLGWRRAPSSFLPPPPVRPPPQPPVQPPSPVPSSPVQPSSPVPSSPEVPSSPVPSSPEAPVQPVKKSRRDLLKVTCVFDSDPYGAAYMSVAPGDFVFTLDPPEPPEGWLFVERVDNGLRGWIPPDYVAPSAFVLEEC